jgi:hypothetical protein
VKLTRRARALELTAEVGHVDAGKSSSSHSLVARPWCSKRLYHWLAHAARREASNLGSEDRSDPSLVHANR